MRKVTTRLLAYERDNGITHNDEVTTTSKQLIQEPTPNKKPRVKTAKKK